jgi:glycosyltransferase involved in cell wall biosynthesis
MPSRRILCFASWFLPGYKSGGPVRSLLNLATGLGGDLEFRVVTRDRDLGDDRPYPGRNPGQWYAESGVRVRYLRPPYWRPGPFRQVIRDWQPDLLYFNSFMDPALSIAPLAWRAASVLPAQVPVLIAPRGEFSPGALALKQGKKAAFLRLARAAGIYRDVTWHATSAAEAAQLRAWWGSDARIVEAPNLPPRIAVDRSGSGAKEPGALKVTFLARISRMKNLDMALEVLQGVQCRVQFDIYGTLEDESYWAECRALMAALPRNVSATYRGPVAPDEVPATLARADVLLLPTRGENFGHVILEALLAGCPVIVSDQTPWHGLEEAGAGFDLPLGRPDGFRAAIERFAAMPGAEFERWSDAARAAGLAYSARSGRDGPMRNVLETAMAAHGQ